MDRLNRSICLDQLLSRSGEGYVAWGVLRWGVVGRVSGVPQRGVAYQLGVKPWVRDKPNRCVLKKRGSAL